MQIREARGPFPASSFSQTFETTLYIPVLPLSRNRTADFSFLSIARDATCAFCRASPCMARHDGTYRRWQAGFFNSPALCPFGNLKALSGAFAELQRPFPSREVGLTACMLDDGCWMLDTWLARDKTRPRSPGYCIYAMLRPSVRSCLNLERTLFPGLVCRGFLVSRPRNRGKLRNWHT